jgi:hypothetical protein
MREKQNKKDKKKKDWKVNFEINAINIKKLFYQIIIGALQTKIISVSIPNTILLKMLINLIHNIFLLIEIISFVILKFS